MQAYLLSSTARIRHWRDFRKTFNEDQSDEEQLLETANYWQEFPIHAHYIIDVDRPKRWPTPWELLHKGDFCTNSLAYMMEQTLLLADERWTKDRFQLMFIDNKTLSAMAMILVVDNKYVLNYSQNQIFNFDFIEKTCIIQYRYRALSRHKHKII